MEAGFAQRDGLSDNCWDPSAGFAHFSLLKAVQDDQDELARTSFPVGTIHGLWDQKG